MNTRKIYYVPKNTGANTNYRELQEEDMAWLQSELIRWMAEVSETAMLRDEDSKYIVDQWWMKRSTLLPRNRTGQNTPYTFVGGMVKNLVFGTQRDLTDKQMEAIEVVSRVMAQIYQDRCTSVQFQIGFTR
jgi:hypothetical protein